MAIGERIHFFRLLRGMTQKYLGTAVGFPERSADVRLAQYETGFRHYHSWSFPYANMYGWMPRCFHQGGQLETSLTQPAWSGSDPVYSNLLYPEWMALGAITEERYPSFITSNTGIALLFAAANCSKLSA